MHFIPTQQDMEIQPLVIHLFLQILLEMIIPHTELRRFLTQLLGASILPMVFGLYIITQRVLTILPLVIGHFIITQQVLQIPPMVSRRFIPIQQVVTITLMVKMPLVIIQQEVIIQL